MSPPLIGPHCGSYAFGGLSAHRRTGLCLSLLPAGWFPRPGYARDSFMCFSARFLVREQGEHRVGPFRNLEPLSEGQAMPFLVPCRSRSWFVHTASSAPEDHPHVVPREVRDGCSATDMYKVASPGQRAVALRSTPAVVVASKRSLGCDCRSASLVGDWTAVQGHQSRSGAMTGMPVYTYGSSSKVSLNCRLLQTRTVGSGPNVFVTIANRHFGFFR